MRGNRTIVFALLLIGIGVVLLLEQVGVIPRDVRIWPVVLIGVGAILFVDRVVAGGGGSGFVAPMVLIAIGLAFLLDDLGAIEDEGVLLPLVVIAVGVGLMLSAGTSRSGPAPERVAVALRDASSATVRVSHGAGRLVLGSHVAGENLLEGSFAGSADVRERRDGGRLEVDLSANPFRGRVPLLLPRPGGMNWSVTLTRRIPLVLELRTGADHADIDLATLQVERLWVETGASKTTITLPGSGRPSVQIRVGAAELVLEVPAQMTAHIVVRGGLADVKIDPARFPTTGVDREYRSVGFDGSVDRAEIAIDAGAASVTVR